MKNVLLVLSAFLLFVDCQAQNTQQISKRKLLKDFAVFQSIYEKANAGIYKYHTKHEVDSAFAVNRKLIQSHTSYRDFYNLVWNVIDFTGSCHNELGYPDTLLKTIGQEKIFFPLPLKYTNGKLYSHLAYQNIPLGSEIVSVNDINAAEFAHKVSRYLSTDGQNVSGKYAFIESRLLSLFVYLAYGAQDHFTIAYTDSSVVRQVVLDPVDMKDAVYNYKKRFVPDYRKNKENYAFKYLDETGYLTVNTFALGSPKSVGHKKYAAFLDSVFNDLQSKNIQKLIVDVRQNGGGNDPNDLLLYSYLTKRNFRENRTAFTAFNTVPLKQFYVEEEKGEIKDLEEDLKEEHNVFKDGKYYQNEKFNRVWTPKSNAFSGKIYLLISPFVASAGSLFACMVKSDEQSVLIGQETLGGYYGHTGHIPVSYKLPHTKLLLTFSIVDLEQDVQPLPDQKISDGIKPDYAVEQPMEDYLKSVDTVLEFAKSLLDIRH